MNGLNGVEWRIVEESGVVLDMGKIWEIMGKWNIVKEF